VVSVVPIYILYDLDGSVSNENARLPKLINYRVPPYTLAALDMKSSVKSSKSVARSKTSNSVTELVWALNQVPVANAKNANLVLRTTAVAA